MPSFKQFVTELAGEHVTLPPAEVEEVTRRFGNKVLQMGVNVDRIRHMEPSEYWDRRIILKGSTELRWSRRHGG
jgi:hypothetical protein